MMANTSASSTVCGLMPCCDWIADSAASRSAVKRGGLERKLGGGLFHLAASSCLTRRLLPTGILGLAHQLV